MIRFFKNMHFEADEMIKLKQDRVAAGSFWVMFYLTCTAIIVQNFIFENQAIQYTLPLYIILAAGTIYYFRGVYKNYLPLMPAVKNNHCIILYIATAVILGLAMGIRNGFFLYAENMAAASLITRFFNTAVIALIFGSTMMVFFLIVHILVLALSKKQNDRINKKIKNEN